MEPEQTSRSISRWPVRNYNVTHRSHSPPLVLHRPKPPYLFRVTSGGPPFWGECREGQTTAPLTVVERGAIAGACCLPLGSPFPLPSLQLSSASLSAHLVIPPTATFLKGLWDCWSCPCQDRLLPLCTDSYNRVRKQPSGPSQITWILPTSLPASTQKGQPCLLYLGWIIWVPKVLLHMYISLLRWTSVGPFWL